MSTNHFTLRVPLSGVTARVDEGGFLLEHNGNLTSVHLSPLITGEVLDQEVVLQGDTSFRKLKAILFTTYRKLLAGIKGLLEGYSWTLGLYYRHFPVEVEVTDNEIILKNFFRRRKPIKVPLRGVTVTPVSKGLNQQVFTFSCHDLEAIGNLYVRLKNATKDHRDKRIFWDGFYILRRN